MERGESEPAWVADPRIAWRILLSAELSNPLDEAAASRALAHLHETHGWPGHGLVIEGDDVDAVRRELAGTRGPAVSLGLVGPTLVVSAHHSRVDGLGLLQVLTELTGAPVSSSARGVAERPDAGGLGSAVARRLLEVATSPPARISGADGDGTDAHDVFVEQVVPGRLRTADLVHAGAQGVVAHHAAHHAAHHRAHDRTRRRRPRHVAVAVGVSRAGAGAGGVLRDRSALLRLRDVERLGLGEITDLLRTAPTQPSAHGTAGGGAVLGLGMRLLAPRLGSTLLVSHLGAVTAPGVQRLAFHPVTAGGSGISLGALTLEGATVITLRARGLDWTHHGLEQLLEAVVQELPDVRR